MLCSTTCLLQLSWANPVPDMRVIWCHYIPEENEDEEELDEDNSQRLAVAIGPKVAARLWG